MKRPVAILCISIGSLALFGQTAIPDVTPTPKPAQTVSSQAEATTATGVSLSGALNTPAERAGLAMTSPEYPVTPGDVYTLTFISANGVVASSIIVDSEGGVNLSNLGKIDAKGLRFAELRKMVEKKVLDAYALSAPQLIIQSCGVFPVYVEGEVTKDKTEYLWGLSRLDELWKEVTTYASNRDVKVVDKEGQSHSFDLYKAWRYGDLSQNPYLRPFDHVVFSKYSRSVSLTGEVRRPGTYQLLPGDEIGDLVAKFGDGYTVNADPTRIRIDRRKTGTELANSILFFDASVPNATIALKDQDTITVQPRIPSDHSIRTIILAGEVRRPGTYQLISGEGLKDLIEVYGDGFSPKADPSRLVLVRLVNSRSGIGETRVVDFNIDSNLELLNADSITVPPLQDLLPVAYFEGAVGVGANGVALQASQRLPYTFFPGETLGQATQKLRAQFTAVSDLVNAYVIRGSQKIPENLAQFLASSDFSADIALQQADVVLVPFRQFFVSVSGAVNLPGRYPYVPDRNWEYYVNLAGGFDEDKNSYDKVDIIDVKGMRQSKTRLIQPEDSIVAATNSGLYIFGKYAAIITTILSLLTTILYLRTL